MEVVVTSTDHAPESLRKVVLSHIYGDCRSLLRAMALVIEDTLSRGKRSV